MKNNKFNSQRSTAERGINPAIAAVLASDSNLSYNEACALANRKALKDLCEEEWWISRTLWEAAIWQNFMLDRNMRGYMELEDLAEMPADGRVAIILEENLHKFLLLCKKGERKCTFDAFASWAHSLSKREEAKGLPFHKEVNKACRKAWKAIPKELRKGGKATSNGEMVYSSKEDLQEVIKNLKGTIEFLEGSKSLRARRKAAVLREDLMCLEGKMTQKEAFGWEDSQDFILGQKAIPTQK